MGDRKPDSSDLMKLVLLPIIHSLFKILANYVTGMFLNAHCFCRERWWSADLGQGIKKGALTRNCTKKLGCTSYVGKDQLIRKDIEEKEIIGN